MYLKGIRAQGFKSFADKLDLEINPGITGIVGPNGSGKSNIVDAVRWVLGEQSVKSLRGSSSMSDIIFSGSASREAQKRAMVALTFDNHDHYLNSEYNEVEIKRIVYATGENEYFINNSKVRLKDITDLFIESGAGANAFNIISQGNVTDIVNSKSSDRRIIFESAAGVLKYKKRKEESLKKLDKTEENLTRIKLITNELEKTVEPLKEQSQVAKKYLELKSELENIDIALIVDDIAHLNEEYGVVKKDIEILKNKLASHKNSEIDVECEKLKLQNLELEEKINTKRNEVREIEEKLFAYESEKRITLERQKYEVNKEQVNSNLVSLKESELQLKKNIDILTRDVTDIESNIKMQRDKSEALKDRLLVLKVKKSTLQNRLQEKNKEILVLQNRIDILDNNIMNANLAPTAVRNVLGNPRLMGIHSTLGKLINLEDTYLVALDVALGNSANYIVCETEESATQAISYLKDHRLGRATFLPLNIIKGRHIEESVLKQVKDIHGFIGVLADLVSYEKKYQDVIENQIGNVLVVNNANTLNVIGKLINYKYRVVTLDGEILHAGGSITGGTSKKNSMINEKNELNHLKEDLNDLQVDLETLTNEFNDISDEIEEVENQDNVINKYIILFNEELHNKKTSLSRMIDEHKEKQNELEGMDDLLANKLDDKLVELLENINATSKQKELFDKELNKIVKEKKDIVDKITVLEKKQKDANSSYREITNDLKDKEVKLGKMEVTLDNLLLTLNNEYNKTYEYASVSYSLDTDVDTARDRVKSLKKELSKLGNVNVGSIAEYERLNKRYEFLNNQKEDLEKASGELKEIIGEMDDIMVDKFKTTFDKIKEEFTRIFKLMFKGGVGELKLSDPDDLLNTGVDIIAIPPGKKINSPMSLSGGEKALTAIVLLFAMLQVRPSPFVILDEAEAALDEVNVDMFGKYLNQEKKRSQFLVITHKKRMMEYADSLYGITMQESGVSKIVSAKLEEA